MKKLKTFTKNIKKIFNKEYLEKNLGVVMLGILILIFLVFTLIYFIGTRRVSSIEEKLLKEKSKNLVNYIDDITLSKSDKVDKYIIFALDYSYNVNSKNELTYKEIYDFLKENFTKKFTEEEIKNCGVTSEMLERNITQNNLKESYTMNIVKNDAETISKTKIVYYKLEKIRKINKNKYRMYYRQYTIENPYDMLNFYLEKNMNAEGKEDELGEYKYDLYDITPIRNYLMGNGKIADVKNNIIDSDISKYAKKGKKIKITYTISDDKLLINKIK